MDGKLTINTVPTAPIAGQAMGTSGLRKKVAEFQKPHYIENFVQAIFNSLPAQELKGSTLVVSGDGRYYNKEVALTIIRIAAANGVGKIIAGTDFIMSTPCVSYVIRHRKAYGGIVLTASHNPGGPTEDFGIKYNASNGGPAPEAVTNEIYRQSQAVREYRIANETPQLDPSKPGTAKFGELEVEFVDAPKQYADLMRSIFDFERLRAFLTRPDFSFVYDAMHGVAGPFAREILVGQLGAPESSLLNCDPKPDFGGGHPDPNLTYARELVDRLGLGGQEAKAETIPDFGAASDGDADRNMILGRKFFVTPSDSVAIIAANAASIPYFAKTGLKGVARSMPTSAALDRVAEKLGVPCFEVPTGWKFFGNLMDAGRLSICGEESFGTGSDHIREKDGLWAILAWLAILEAKNRDVPVGMPLVSVRDVVLDHWRTYGRNYYSRYDYESVETEQANAVMDGLLELVAKANATKDMKLGDWPHPLKTADEFSYTDPVDKSVAFKQGIRFIFADGSRVVYRDRKSVV